jgi:eukaryotic-like serine/threonine-protein kinase
LKYCDTCSSSYPVDFATCPKDQSTLRSITELMPGLLLRGKYQILERLGQGGMGAVYKAKHVAFGEIRAIKFIGSHLIGDQEFLARFRGEAVLARKLLHPNVVRVEDLDTTDDGRPFIVMEYVEGRSLRSVLRNEPAVGLRRSVEIVIQACSALSAAHVLGILHRDIKPENMVLVASATNGEVVKVLDFGLAKVLEGFEGAGQQVSTQTGMLVGTPQYISPEQAMPAKGIELDGRVDLYSLGIVLYELLTGHLPFHADTPVGMVLHHIQTRPEPPHEVYPDRSIPPALSDVVMKALSKNREDRFASADEMRAALAALVATLPEDPVSTSSAAALRPDSQVRDPRASPTHAPTPATILVTRQVAGLAPPGAATGGPPPRPGVPTSPSVPTVPRPTARATPAPSTAPSPARSRPRPRPTFPAAEVKASKSRLGLYVSALVVVAAIWLGFTWSRNGAPLPQPSPSTEASETATPATPPESTAEPEATDEDVLAEVQRLITTSGALQDARIDVGVANGIVTLSGETPTGTARELAVSLAGTVSGVKRVFNMVKVTPVVASTNPIVMSTPAPVELQTPPPTVVTEPSRPTPPPESSREREIRELLGQARRQIDSGDHDGAGRSFEAVLRLDPNNAVAKDALELRRLHPPPPPPPR